jgi:calcium/calmodulin-dependent protein kinase I
MFAAAAARAARPLACAGLLPAAYLTRRDQDARCLERRLADAYHLLEPERPLGVGGHGVVFPGVNKSSGEIMAIKQVSKKHLPPEALKRLGKRVKEEATLLRVAGEHRSVCSYKELFEGDDAWYIVTELARGGELFDRLVERGAYSPAGAAGVMRELVDAVAYLHQMGIAHLDLKPENVLLKSDETDASDVRLVDFGSARFVGPSSENGEELRTRGAAGATPAYAAPEVLRGDAFDASADLWSLGVILYLLLTGTHPFDARNDADDAEVTRRVLAGADAAGAFKGAAWARVPSAARPLVKRLLADRPSDRPAAAEVLAHAWLQDPTRGEGFRDKAAAKAASDALREFHLGRRRFKAMLLAVMVGYADQALARERGAGTAQLGSRRAAMDVFDSDNNGYVTTEDIKRVARLLGDELDEADTRQMLRSVARPGDDVLKVPKERLRHMLPPLYPAHSLRRGDLVFSAGETDPAFYILLDGDVLISHSFLLRPRSGFASKSGRELSLGLHRLRTGESFGETELLEGVRPRASTATCASTSCALLAVPGHLFQLLGDVFTGVRGPIQDQAAARCRGLVWSWASALAAQPDGGQASRTSMTAGSVAWANMEYADGVVEVDVLDTKTNRRHTHTLWPKDFVYCNERPGAHPLDAAGQFASTVVLALRPVTAAQLTLVHGDVFSQAMSQPSMQQVNTYLVEQFRGEVETVSKKGRIPTHDLVARNGEAL